MNRKIFQIKLANRVRSLRLANHLTQAEFAKKSGIGRSYVSMVEANKSMPTIYVVYHMAKALDVSIDDLLT